MRESFRLLDGSRKKVMSRKKDGSTKDGFRERLECR